MSVEGRVRATGLLEPGRPVLVLLSGGRDSVCLLHLAARITGAARALHVDYGLRTESGADAAHCAQLCERLGVPLHVHRAGAPAGNLQAWARGVRYAKADELAAPDDALVAAGHTATDQVETVLYRLAASPGRRALLGMRPREARLVRPLLGITRAETAEYCAQHHLRWREDASNDSAAYARNRVRHALVPALAQIHPAAETNVLRTLATLRDEAAVLDAVVAEALAAAGDPPRVAELAALPPALARLAVQALAGEQPVASRAEEILALGARGGTATLDLGGGLRAVVEYGRLRFDKHAPHAAPPARPAPVAVPGRTPFGTGELTAERGPGLPIAEGVLDAAACAPGLAVRPWIAGDRMRPLGLGGSRTLQDLFTDRKLPRARRHTWPVVVCGEEIAWVPGVATGERFRVTAATADRVRLSWTPVH
jgi:tRNA(Ile)-lysidine synthase